MLLRSLTLTTDLTQLLLIEQAAADPLWHREHFLIYQGKHYPSWIIEESSQIAGFIITLMHPPEICEILNIGVHPTQQRQGIGKALLLQACNIAKAQGIAQITLEVRSTNQPAIALYQSLGFQPIAERQQYYYTATGQTTLALIFSKAL